MAIGPQEFVAAHVDQVEPLFRDAALAYWEAAISGREEDHERAAQLRAEILRIYANRDAYELVRAWDTELSRVGDPAIGESGDGGSSSATPADALVARQIRLLHNAYAGSQQDEETIARLTALEKEVNAAYTNYRGVYQGKPCSDNELQAVLGSETDSARLEEAWSAGKQIGGQVADRVLQLVALRNASARRMGYPDHYRMSLQLAEIDEEHLFAILGELARLTDEPFRAAKAELDAKLAARGGIEVGDLRPWHYQDPFFQRAPQVNEASFDDIYAERNLEDLAIRTFDGLEMDVRDILARSDLYSREGKDQHAFCTDIDRQGDVRILCNLEPNLRWTETILHELGHAVYDKYMSRDLPYLVREPAHTLLTEAIAMLMGRLPLKADWLEHVVGLPSDEVARIAARAHEHLRLSQLVFVRWALVMTHFERDLYSHPDRDLNTLWWDYVERFQFLSRPPGRQAPDWAAKIHLALYPVYYQNYMLGELVASHLQQVITTRYGRLVGTPAAGEYLVREVFRRGACADWDTTLEQATGERLDPSYFVREFVGE